MKCTNCDNRSEYNLTIGGEDVVLCKECRDKMINGLKNPVGRKPIGITKKVSITLDEELWEKVEDESNGNKSAFFREMTRKYFGK